MLLMRGKLLFVEQIPRAQFLILIGICIPFGMLWFLSDSKRTVFWKLINGFCCACIIALALGFILANTNKDTIYLVTGFPIGLILLTIIVPDHSEKIRQIAKLISLTFKNQSNTISEDIKHDLDKKVDKIK